MPFYEFACSKCEEQVEVVLPVSKRNDPQVHSCGSLLTRVISFPLPAVFKHTAREMALTSINNPKTLPENPKYKPMAEKYIMAGLDNPLPTTGRGF